MATGTGYDYMLDPSEVPKAVEACLTVIRALESTSNYKARNKNCKQGCDQAGCATGAYQYITSIWANYGGFHCASDAPASVQDAKARADVTRILAANGNKLWAVPTTWYIGSFNRSAMGDVPRRDLGNKLTPEQYGVNWLVKGGPVFLAAGVNVKDAVTGHITSILNGGDIASVVSDALPDSPLAAAQSMLDLATRSVAIAASAATWVANPDNWLRIVEVIGGAALLALGLVMVTRDLTIPAAGAALKAAAL